MARKADASVVEKPKRAVRRRTVQPEITPDAIAARAYELYRSGVEGDQLAHWLMAERELALKAA
jgi:hypothetical protein